MRGEGGREGDERGGWEGGEGRGEWQERMGVFGRSPRIHKVDSCLLSYNNLVVPFSRHLFKFILISYKANAPMPPSIPLIRHTSGLQKDWGSGCLYFLAATVDAPMPPPLLIADDAASPPPILPPPPPGVPEGPLRSFPQPVLIKKFLPGLRRC